MRFIRGHNPRRPPAERLWAKVEKHLGDGCWLFTGYRDPAGYGYIGVDGRVVLAHRLAWELTHGPIPEGLDVLHTCDNPPCVRSSHLFLGTDADNAADKVAKGRQAAKLTGLHVGEILRRRAAGETGVAIAAAFGIAQSTVSEIVTGRTWAHLQRRK